MKITIQHYDEKHSVEINEEAHLEKVLRNIVSLLISVGFSEDVIIEKFKEGDPRNWDSAWASDE